MEAELAAAQAHGPQVTRQGQLAARLEQVQQSLSSDQTRLQELQASMQPLRQELEQLEQGKRPAVIQPMPPVGVSCSRSSNKPMRR